MLETKSARSYSSTLVVRLLIFCAIADGAAAFQGDPNTPPRAGDPSILADASVPKVVDLTIQDAKKKLDDANLIAVECTYPIVSALPDDKVVGQVPPAGTKLQAGSFVHVFVHSIVDWMKILAILTSIEFVIILILAWRLFRSRRTGTS
jgi:PASTA domain-containing protein